MLQFFKKIPQKIFGKHKKAKNTVKPLALAEENEAALEPEIIIPVPESSDLQVVNEPEVKEVSFAEEPVRVRRTRNTTFTRRPKTPSPAHLEPAPLQTDREEMYNKIQEQTAALQEKNPIKEVAQESMKDEIVRKAKERRHRTHTHNHHYKGKGKDSYHLEGRELKSVFEDDDGKKLPVDQRQEILRELQKGERKLHFR
jgi:hypothetical protein